ncbi:MAG: PEP-CTERM-box response regulator transcription factor [Deltaproteobacteria bacterium]|nr:PEP-CTERM-box response regulator transcription factor [Deltaproteobacteria bacterium]
MQKHKLLIIEDDDTLRVQMQWALAEMYDVLPAAEPEAALQALQSAQPSLVTLDLGLPPNPSDASAGFRLLGKILQHSPLAKIIVVTGNSGRELAMKAISQGAHDFMVKPVDIDELKIILKRALYIHSLESEQARVQHARESRDFEEILGLSAGMQDVFSTIRKVAATDVPVLVTGESGTGKELVARAIHHDSIRKSRPFVPINCGAIPETLLESELFGHERGAFTGAHAQRSGRIEMAQGGTLFLDEIADLPLPLQVKVLRFLQDHKIERVGGRGSINMDVRVVAAANKCLKKLVMEGKFREDLYYRLGVVNIEVPPLRERGEDIVLLAKAFLNRYSATSPRQKALSAEAVDTINAYNWPGNVRELENRVRRAVTFAEGSLVRPSDLGFGPADETGQNLDLKKAKEDLELKFVQMAIIKHNGNISKAAEELGLSRPTVHHIIKKYNMLESVRKG